MIEIFIFLAGVMSPLGMGLSALYGIPFARSSPIALLATAALLGGQSIVKHRSTLVLLASYLGLTLLLALGVMYTRAPLYGLWKTAFVALYWLVGAALTIHTVRSARKVELFFAGLLVGSIALTLAALIVEGSPARLIARMAMYSRVTIGDANPIRFGQVMSQTVLLCVGYAMYLRSRVYILPTLAIAIIALLLAFSSGSKGPILALIVAFLALIFNNSNKWLRTIVVTALAIYAGVIIMREVLPADFVQTRFRLAESRSVTSRMELIAMAQNEIKEFSVPEFFLGRGSGDYGFLWGGSDGRMYPHNIFAEVGYELGFLGLITLIIGMCIPMLAALRVWRWADFCVWPKARFFLSISTALYVFAITNAQTTGDMASNDQIAAAGAVLLAVIRVIERLQHSRHGIPGVKRRPGDLARSSSEPGRYD